MGPSSDQVAALADELASIAKGLAATEADPMARKRQTHAVVMKAKALISEIQDPMEACMQHTTNVRLPLADLSLRDIGHISAKSLDLQPTKLLASFRSLFYSAAVPMTAC